MVNYSVFLRQMESLIQDVPYATANLANISALLWETLPDINWAGFYQLMDGALVLGPFQGKPACIRIPLGKGVCGTAAAEGKTQRVDNVHEFPGHIACDSVSNSEIVLPLYRGGELWGVLDIDSPQLSRFTREDQEGLEEAARRISAALPGWK